MDVLLELASMDNMYISRVWLFSMCAVSRMELHVNGVSSIVLRDS